HEPHPFPLLPPSLSSSFLHRRRSSISVRVVVVCLGHRRPPRLPIVSDLLSPQSPDAAAPLRFLFRLRLRHHPSLLLRPRRRTPPSVVSPPPAPEERKPSKPCCPFRPTRPGSKLTRTRF
uniref:Uncharacterized protein n=1 Tax=Cucumis melo TaxID=3656 RepID=A0A9I9CD29_CUCME